MKQSKCYAMDMVSQGKCDFDNLSWSEQNYFVVLFIEEEDETDRGEFIAESLFLSDIAESLVDYIKNDKSKSKDRLEDLLRLNAKCFYQERAAALLEQCNEEYHAEMELAFLQHEDDSENDTSVNMAA